MVDPPHEHTEEGLASSEELDFLTDEMFLLGFGFAGAARGGAAAVGGHGAGGGIRRLPAGGANLSATPLLGTNLEAGNPSSEHWPLLTRAHGPHFGPAGVIPGDVSAVCRPSAVSNGRAPYNSRQDVFYRRARHLHPLVGFFCKSASAGHYTAGSGPLSGQDGRDRKSVV